MESQASPLLTAELFAQLHRAHAAGAATLRCSLDLQRTSQQVTLHPDGWQAGTAVYPYWEGAKERTIYAWHERGFVPLARFNGALVKLVPTPWGAPTFEIDGIKMLPSQSVSPYQDAETKVSMVAPRGKALLDCCGGLGYFAAHALAQGARSIVSFEKNPDVLWLRSLNPWSPAASERLDLRQADAAHQIGSLPAVAFDAILHDPPRVSIAAELYSGRFYEALARVLKPHGRLFHYTGAPQRASHGRDLAEEVIRRLRLCGFKAEKALDGVLATRLARRR